MYNLNLDEPTSLIHLTILDNNVELLTLLLNTDAVEDIKDNFGMTSPLSLAIKVDRVELLPYLLKPTTDILDVSNYWIQPQHPWSPKFETLVCCLSSLNIASEY